jgi:Tfp pilus assembly PilM family ATPase
MFKMGQSNPKKPTSALVVDVGASCFRLLQVQRKGDRLLVNAIGRYQLTEEARENRGEEQVTEGLRQLVADARAKQKQVSLSVRCPTERIWYVETPVMNMVDVRKAIRLGATTFLKHDCTDYFLDCAPLTQVASDANSAAVTVEEKAKPNLAETDVKGDGKITKMKVLVAGAHKHDVRYFVGAASKAGLEVPAIALNVMGALNAFEFTMGKAFSDEVLAVVDIGFRNSALNLVHRGKPVLTRLLDWGGDNITQYISQMLSVEWRTAEEEKLKMSEAVQQLARDSLTGLVTHVRSSLDFFDNEFGLAASRLCVAGGTAQSPWIAQSLGEMLGLPCEAWQPNEAFVAGPALKNKDAVKMMGPDFACVAGAAVGMVV